jgi:hypothetical protein
MTGTRSRERIASRAPTWSGWEWVSRMATGRVPSSNASSDRTSSPGSISTLCMLRGDTSTCAFIRHGPTGLTRRIIFIKRPSGGLKTDSLFSFHGDLCIYGTSYDACLYSNSLLKTTNPIR